MTVGRERDRFVHHGKVEMFRDRFQREQDSVPSRRASYWTMYCGIKGGHENASTEGFHARSS